ncbi:hypothetical protein B0J14DRAFT_603401 [Halenospora varia]|nr:hypothetical protein B0J14DRAFT_603401 [Halenospora varia]
MTLMDLPSEIHIAIINQLYLFPDVPNLRCTSRYFYNTTRPPTHDELLATELLLFCEEKQLYSCESCIRLRPNFKF